MTKKKWNRERERIVFLTYILLVWYLLEYCERYAKKQHIDNNLTDESDDVSDNEAFSDGRSDSDDEVAGRADP